MPWIAAGALALVAVNALLWIWAQSQVATPLIRFQIAPPPKTTIDGIPTISPDGQSIAFVGITSGIRMLYVRPLGALEARAVPGTEGALHVFWSPDGRSLGFVTGFGGQSLNANLKRIDLVGGGPRVLFNAAGGYNGTWNQQGDILFQGPQRNVILHISTSGGAVTEVTQLDPKKGEFANRFPKFLPDGRHFLFYAYGKDQAHNAVQFATLGSFDRKTVLENVSAAIHARGPDGKAYVLYQRNQTLLAQRFDESAGFVSGEAASVAEGLAGVGQNGMAPAVSASLNGTLVYRSGLAGRSSLTWFDREGKTIATAGAPSDYSTVSLSPDGSRAVVSSTEGGNFDLWVLEFARGTSTRLTFDPAQDHAGVWSPDGSRIIFSSQRDGPFNLYQKAASGATNEDPVFRSTEQKWADDWSRDGRFLLYTAFGGGGTGNDLWVLPLEGERKPQVYLKTGFSESQGRFSPDGRFIAYSSNASGQNEIYVRPFPMVSSGQWLVSKGGGVQPRWRGDGKELLYISSDSKMMAVDVSTAPMFRAAVPKPLFTAPILGAGFIGNVFRYDVTPDGKRFLINSVSEISAGEATPITVVLNWPSLLRK